MSSLFSLVFNFFLCLKNVLLGVCSNYPARRLMKNVDVCSIVAWRRYCIFVCDVFGRDRLQYGFFAPAGLQQTSPGYRLQLLELSDMAQSLVLSMSTLEDQPSVRLQLLKTLKVLSGFSGQ